MLTLHPNRLLHPVPAASPANPHPRHPPPRPALRMCRADWKACSASKQEEEARTERFKKVFQQYDIMQ